MDLKKLNQGCKWNEYDNYVFVMANGTAVAFKKILVLK